jgi:hypothetical protein
MLRNDSGSHVAAKNGGLIVKRFFVVFMLFVLGYTCFGKGERDSFEVGFGYHSITETAEVSGIEVKTTVPSYAINFAGVTFYTEKVGIGAYGNLLFPQEFKASAQGKSATVDKSAYDFLFAMDFLVGPAIMLYKNETFCLPLAVGLHYYHLWANAANGSTNSSEIGIGANITGECHFNPTVYIYGRFQLLFDFYSWGTVEVYNGYASASAPISGDTSVFGVEPCIGIGFQW